jgi:hypothetical protein
MPQPKLKGENVFHVIGFSNQDILNGTHLHLMQRAVAQAERKLIEVYFVDPFVLPDNTFREQYGDKYKTVYFYNDAALHFSSQYHVELPPVIGDTTRAELPKGYGTSMA